MASFDLDAYYAEQDARMNQRDETVDQFRQRLSGFNGRYVQLIAGPVANSKIPKVKDPIAHQPQGYQRREEVSVQFRHPMKKLGRGQSVSMTVKTLEIISNAKHLCNRWNLRENDQRLPVRLSKTKTTCVKMSLQDSTNYLGNPFRTYNLQINVPRMWKKLILLLL